MMIKILLVFHIVSVINGFWGNYEVGRFFFLAWSCVYYRRHYYIFSPDFKTTCKLLLQSELSMVLSIYSGQYRYDIHDLSNIFRQCISKTFNIHLEQHILSRIYFNKSTKNTAVIHWYFGVDIRGFLHIRVLSQARNMISLPIRLSSALSRDSLLLIADPRYVNLSTTSNE